MQETFQTIKYKIQIERGTVRDLRGVVERMKVEAGLCANIKTVMDPSRKGKRELEIEAV